MGFTNGFHLEAPLDATDPLPIQPPEIRCALDAIVIDDAELLRYYLIYHNQLLPPNEDTWFERISAEEPRR